MSILDEIFARKAEEVAEAKRRAPLADLRLLIHEATPPRRFALTIKDAYHRLALIAEVKKASPSKGLIREDFDPTAIAKSYEKVGAHCLSVLTDVDYFQGSSRYLKKARKATSLPCLRKDFINDEYQVFESRAWGADAILLIAASLTKDQLEDLHGIATGLGMDVLVEVHNEEEAQTAIDIKCPLIGVNNRNLADFKTDLTISDRLLPTIRKHAIAISESALENPADLDRVRRAGARAVLIGTAFCAAPDIEAKVKEVMGW